VQKLLALSRGTNNPNEAAAAMRKATELVERHRLEMADVEGDGAAGDKPTLDQHPLVEAGKIENWNKTLTVYLAEANSCCVVGGRYMRHGHFIQYSMLVGRPSDIAIVRELYTYLILELTRRYKADQRTDYLHRGSWWDGAVRAVGVALQAGKKAARATASTTAIVLVDKRALEAAEELKRACPKIRDKTVKTPKVEVLSWHKGAAAGKKAMSSRSGTRLEPPRNTDETSTGQLGFGFGSAYTAPRSKP